MEKEFFVNRQDKLKGFTIMGKDAVLFSVRKYDLVGSPDEVQITSDRLMVLQKKDLGKLIEYLEEMYGDME